MDSPISLSFVAALTDRTRQNVFMAGDTRKYFDSHFRRIIMSSPEIKNIDYRNKGTCGLLLKIKKSINNTLVGPMMLRICDFDYNKKQKTGKKGRPVKDSPKHLAEFLGIVYNQKKHPNVFDVLEEYTKKVLADLGFSLKAIRKAYRKEGKKSFVNIPFYKVIQELDKIWLPRWVSKRASEKWLNALFSYRESKRSEEDAERFLEGMERD